ncbi:hypothetical protein ACFE04_020374 [Oxalis oulophora]
MGYRLLKNLNNLLSSSSSSSKIIRHLTYPIPKRSIFGHSHSHDHHQINGTTKEGEKIFRLGLAADIGLTAGKAFTGYLSGSTAIIADAAHSLSDVVLSGIALWSYKAANVPKDKEHPYGHGKFETLGALTISIMLFATGGGIAWHAIDVFLGHQHGGRDHGIDMAHPVLAFNMTLLSIAVKEGLYWVTKQAGEKQGSGLMKANAWHHRADAISSVVALFGVGGSILGLKFLDPLAGLFVAGMILKAGAETGYESVLELVDAAIPSEQLDKVRNTIIQVEGVKGCHRLRGRRAGSFLYLDVHIEVGPFLPVSAAHGIGENVRRQIHMSHPGVSEVFIHIDPSYLQIPPSWINHSGILEWDRKKANLEDKDIEAIISEVSRSKCVEKMVVENITRHMLQSKIFLQVEISMNPDIVIRDAMKVAEEVEKEILKAASNIAMVSIQLVLGYPLPKVDK